MRLVGCCLAVLVGSRQGLGAVRARDTLVLDPPIKPRLIVPVLSLLAVITLLQIRIILTLIAILRCLIIIF